jgi:integrase
LPWISGAWITFRVRKGGAPPTKKRVSGWTARRLWRLTRTHSSPKVFGFVNRSSIYKPARDIYREAGVGFGRNVFHAWRKSHASHVRHLGGDATAALGHADKLTTDRYYIDPKVCPPPQSVDLLFRPLSRLGTLLGWLGW